METKKRVVPSGGIEIFGSSKCWGYHQSFFDLQIWVDLGTIDGVQRMLVRTKKLGASPLKCAYVESRRAVAVACDAEPSGAAAGRGGALKD